MKRVFSDMVEREVETELAEEHAVQKDSIVQRIVHMILSVNEIVGPDRSAICEVMHKSIADLVAAKLRGMQATKTDRFCQQMLPGLDQLQSAYQVTRGGKTWLVEIDSCTDDELRTKSQEHRVQAAGHNRHSDHLDEYLAARIAARQKV